MAPKTKKIGSGNKSGGSDESILEKISNSDVVSHGKRAACDAVYVSKKLFRSTGKAAWIVGTTFLIIVLPWIVVVDREQHFKEIEFEQATLLGTPPPAGSMM